MKGNNEIICDQKCQYQDGENIPKKYLIQDKI